MEALKVLFWKTFFHCSYILSGHLYVAIKWLLFFLSLPVIIAGFLIAESLKLLLEMCHLHKKDTVTVINVNHFVNKRLKYNNWNRTWNKDFKFMYSLQSNYVNMNLTWQSIFVCYNYYCLKYCCCKEAILDWTKY